MPPRRSATAQALKPKSPGSQTASIEAALHAELTERRRERLDPAFVIDAHDHVGRAGRIDERAEDVEDGLGAAFGELLAHAEHGLERRMEGGRVEVTEVRLAQAAQQLFVRGFKHDAQAREEIRAA